MNRLWVRIGLTFFSIIFFIVLIPITLNYFGVDTVNDDNPLAQIKELALVEDFDGIIAIVEQQERILLSSLSRLLVLTGFVGSLVGVIISRSLTRPLDSLKEAADRLQQKDFTVRVPEEGTQEIRSVSRSFNDMATRLEKAEELRRNLLTDVAHELRNPLHIIKGNIEAMLDGVFPRDDAELERLLSQTELLTTLVSDLHELAQAEANQLQLERQPVEISKFLDKIVTDNRPNALDKEIDLKLALLGKLPTLHIDSARMQQVINNLLSNALRYTPQNGIISVSAEQIEQEMIIKVKDSGSGIEPENLPYIFDRFYRTDKARTRAKGGTGLGLAITKALVEAHDGTICAHSEGGGKGSEFTLRLPVI